MIRVGQARWEMKKLIVQHELTIETVLKNNFERLFTIKGALYWPLDGMFPQSTFYSHLINIFTMQYFCPIAIWLKSHRVVLICGILNTRLHLD